MSQLGAQHAPIPIGQEAKPPFAVLPDPRSLFLNRSKRLRALADGHILETYLRFVADVTEAQHETEADLSDSMPPDAAKTLLAMEHGMPPLSRTAYRLEDGAETTLIPGSVILKQGQYFAARRRIMVIGGKGIIIEAPGYDAMELFGGPVEAKGRLRYIDGCTDSLLIPPVKRGDPCLNALFFPPGINQTAHTHPSFRAGLVIDGGGECVLENEVVPLAPGSVFLIREGGLHRFRTAENQHLTVIAYHPDSDFGPMDEDHPMKS